MGCGAQKAPKPKTVDKNGTDMKENGASKPDPKVETEPQKVHKKFTGKLYTSKNAVRQKSLLKRLTVSDWLDSDLLDFVCNKN
ncbi:hypothetical protein AAMO2058_000607800 [Amorphochlora amoebiformis]|eukprot:1320999-Amorphochlora_amoeboformis.AAC.2